MALAPKTSAPFGILNHCAVSKLKHDLRLVIHAVQGDRTKLCSAADGPGQKSARTESGIETRDAALPPGFWAHP